MASVNRNSLSLFYLMMLLGVSESTSLPDLVFYFCPNSTASSAPNSEYQANLGRLFFSLLANAVSNPTSFYSTSIGNDTKDAVYGLYLCRGDQNSSECSGCVSKATSVDLPYSCPNRKEAIIWYDECMVRYSNQSMFGRMDQTPSLILMNVLNIDGDEIHFRKILGQLLNNVSNQAAMGGQQEKFATDTGVLNSLANIYTLGQCTPDLSASDCNHCLMIAIGRLPIRRGARVLQPSCSIRYEMYPFFYGAADAPLTSGASSTSTTTSGIMGLCMPHVSPTECSQCIKNAMDKLQSSDNSSIVLRDCKVTGPSSPSQAPNSIGKAPSEISPDHPSAGHGTKGKRLRIHMLIAVSTFIAISLVVFGIWMLTCKGKEADDTPNLDVDEIRTMESLQYDLSIIKAATRNFSVDNKLGEGGFGAVYKGILDDGQEIAVKRLSKSSGQGVVEFKTEVLLVAKLQHKNLVKLQGFCLESKEKILIYEYLQNSSLDQQLFDSMKKLSLDWETRFKIITGIARGLMYLHEDSRLKIIHRDLKPSNILLDNGMNPKISDFGLAKLFGVDQTQDDTKRIVGTYGYMAPEYAMTGHFSVKSDVYSFGIIILEIVSGRKNRFFGRPQLDEALLHRAWRIWNERNPLHLVDTTLDNKYPKEEVTKCIHIGLLCIQENASERPRMATIIAALSGQSVSLPMPKAPKCFGDSNVTTDMASALYRLPMGENEVEYRQVLDQRGSPCIYSGTEEITDLNPR